MVLWISVLFSIFYRTAGKSKQCRNLRGPFTLSLDCDGSEIVNCNSVVELVVDRYIVSLIRLITVASGNWFCAGLVYWDALLGVSSYAVSTLSTDKRFFVCGFLRGMQADKTLDVLSSRSAWFGPSLRPGKPSNAGPRPYRFGSDNCGCQDKCLAIFYLPGRRLPAFFSIASTCVEDANNRPSKECRICYKITSKEKGEIRRKGIS